MLGLRKHYTYLFRDLADPRVLGWTFMTDPTATLLIIALYLVSVYLLLPSYMKGKKPFQLKSIIFYYNILQIITCTYIMFGVMLSGWTTTYSLGCQPVDYSNEPMPVRMLTFVYYTYLLKMAELIETVFFVLRKKYSQVSKLHIYHHTSTLMLAWIGTKYVGGGMATFPIMANCFIHILMYTYYLLSSLGPQWQKRLAPWKPKLTILQMVQFAVIVAHALQALHPSCLVPKKLLWMYVPNVGLIAYMFWQFYRNSYSNKSSKYNKKTVEIKLT